MVLIPFKATEKKEKLVAKVFLVLLKWWTHWYFGCAYLNKKILAKKEGKELATFKYLS